MTYMDIVIDLTMDVNQTEQKLSVSVLYYIKQDQMQKRSFGLKVENHGAQQYNEIGSV